MYDIFVTSVWARRADHMLCYFICEKSIKKNTKIFITIPRIEGTHKMNDRIARVDKINSI